MTSFTDISKWWKSVENDREPGRLTLVLCSKKGRHGDDTGKMESLDSAPGGSPKDFQSVE
jgi:hypothetical protein